MTKHSIVYNSTAMLSRHHFQYYNPIDKVSIKITKDNLF